MNLFDTQWSTADADAPALIQGPPHERMWEMITAHRISQTAALGASLWDCYRDSLEESAHCSQPAAGVAAAIGAEAPRLIDSTPFVMPADIGGAGSLVDG